MIPLLAAVIAVLAYLHLLGRFNELTSLMEAAMALIDDVLAEAQRNSTIGDSVLALVQKLVDSAGGDPVKLQQILDTLKADSDKLEAAVVANTAQGQIP